MFGFKKPKKKELENKDHAKFEKGDLLAIILAAAITIIPVVVLILGIFYLIMYLLFLR